MTKFEDVLETILEEYARRDSEGEFDTWEETDAFVKEKAEVLLAYAKEPISEELESEIQRYYVDWDEHPQYVQTARHFARWQKEQFEKERLKHCDELTPQQAQIESDFVTQHLKKHNRTPTFIDAIEYGMKMQKERLMKDATEAYIIRNKHTKKNVLNGLDVTCDAIQNFNDGDKIKIIFIKEE